MELSIASGVETAGAQALSLRGQKWSLVMIGRQWLGDVGLAILLVLPTAGLMWPAPSSSVQPAVQSRALTGLPVVYSPIEQRFGIER